MANHSTFSASAASRWLACPGSIVLSEGLPDTSSKHSAAGTVAHALLEDYLVRSQAPEGALGTWVLESGHSIPVDQEMVDAVRSAITHIDEMTKLADIRQAETQVNYAAWLDVPRDQGYGTADLIAVFSEQRELLVGDYKHGQGVVVDAKGNEQMMLYAAGALVEMDALGIDIDTIRMVIFQPRVSETPSEWVITRTELVEWLRSTARSGAMSVLNAQQTIAVVPFDGPTRDTWNETFLRPGDKQCRWCKAKPTCPALRDMVASVVECSTPPATPEEFEEMTAVFADDRFTADWLAACLSKVDLIEDWCKAVRAEAERRLLAGDTVPGYKLVQGKRGNRAWSSEEQAEEVLRKQMRLPIEKAYNLKLITPPQAEKLAKAGDIGPRQWPKLQALITQSEGKPHVAPADDPRPPITVQPVDDAFEVQAGEPTYPSVKDEASFEDIC